MTFEQWLLCIGKSPKSAKNYRQAIEVSTSNWAIQSNLIDESLINVKDFNEFKFVTEKIKKLDAFLAFDSKGKGMYSAALKHYAAYLDDLTGQSLSDDITAVISDTHISETEKTQLINARIGQGEFRKNLLTYWKNCSITGFKNPRFLVASHIKPWRVCNNQERLDANNGLLLLPNHDKAFDMGYITFTNEGKIVISKHLEQANDIGIHTELFFEIKQEHKKYMSFHRNSIFEKFVDAAGKQ